MPFGKHQGEEVTNVPETYLRWVLDNCGNASPELFRAIREHLKLPQPPDEALLAVGQLAVNMAAKTLVSLGKWREKTRAYLLTYHPDDKEAFAAVETVFDRVTDPFVRLQSIVHDGRRRKSEAGGEDPIGESPRPGTVG
jgi:hypothetical protein